MLCPLLPCSRAPVLPIHVAYAFADQAELETALDLWCTDQAAAMAAYGLITTWVTSALTSMVGLYSPHYVNGAYSYNARPHLSTCNAEVGNFDTSAVTDME